MSPRAMLQCTCCGLLLGVGNFTLVQASASGIGWHVSAPPVKTPDITDSFTEKTPSNCFLLYKMLSVLLA